MSTGSCTVRTDWNFADVWEEIAERQPDASALTHVRDAAPGHPDVEVVDWAGFDRAADGVAQWLLSVGLGRHDVVAVCLRNRPEYLIVALGAMKVAAVPAHTNVRYTTDELGDLWTRAGVRAVIYEQSLAAAVMPLVGRLDGVRGWLCVGDDIGPVAAVPPVGPVEVFSEVVARGCPQRRRRAGHSRSGDDPYVLFTGGTTGRPKGVVWRQDDLFVLLNRSAQRPWDERAGLEGLARDLGAGAARPPTLLVAAPLMHGLGGLTAMSALSSAGSVVTLAGASFSATSFLDAAQQCAATQATIVGDAMARPVLREIENEPQRWRLPDLRVLLSSGTTWTGATKQAIARRFPAVRCVDVLGATEAIGVASAVTTGGGRGDAAAFVLGPDAAVLDEEGRPMTPGSGAPGRIVVRGRRPLGYLGEETLTTRDASWTPVGDWATVEADGTVRLLGRGSSVINTGGEKVFPDEIEDALRRCPGVRDAAVMGVADSRLGQQVVALVQPAPGAEPDAAMLRELLRATLAGFKLPRAVHVVDDLGRSADGKLDRRLLERRAAELTVDSEERKSHARR